MKRTTLPSLLAGLMVLFIFVVLPVSAFEISGMYTEEGQNWLNEHWGENITWGDVEKIAFTKENYEKINENVDSALLEKMRSKPYFWGDRYPPREVTPGPKIFDENNQLVSDPDGSILAGIMCGKIQSLRSGIIVSANPVGYSGGYITYGGGAYVYAADPVGSLRTEARLHGNGVWLQTSYNVATNYDNSPYWTVSTSGIRSPVHDTLYQSQTSAVSTNPDNTASTWSSSYYYS